MLLRKGAEEESTLAAIHKKVDQLNNGILPPGVTVVPMLDRADLLHFTLTTVEHNLTEGMILVSVILFLFLLNVRAATDRCAHNSIFIDVCIDMAQPERNSCQPAVAGGLSISAWSWTERL